MADQISNTLYSHSLSFLCTIKSLIRWTLVAWYMAVTNHEFQQEETGTGGSFTSELAMKLFKFIILLVFVVFIIL